jgi:magnesium-transporting ATPase (P-type)
MGTAVTSGGGIGVVTAIGTETEVGQISEQVEEAGTTETPLQRRIDRLARWITVGMLAIAAITFVIGLLLGRSVEDMLLLAVALAVSAIPAGLPIVVTVALAIGVSRMARRHALIRKLPAVDTLGSCTTIVSDKTGTLTENRMTVQALYGGDRRFDLDDDNGDGDGTQIDTDDPVLHELLLVALLCNDAELDADGEGDGDGDGEGEGDGDGDGDDGDRSDDADSGTSPGGKGDPMEIALLAAGRKLGVNRDELAERHPLRDKVPFRTEQRFMATIHDPSDSDGEGPLVLVKGAPERVVDMCEHRRNADGDEEPIDRDALIEVSESLAEEGLRVLAMAVGRGEQAAEAVGSDDPSGLVFVGMTGLLDPPRPSATEAVDRCHEAGIRVIMVTGDHATTAATIGRRVHLGRSNRDDEPLAVRTGQELAELSDEELDAVLAEVDIYSRVAPDQKLRIVERLKAADEVVAVTGDGVNDAPALQAAHIGAAMGSGTDVAKETSDMVITDDDFASVYAAVEEGRTAFRNIRMATFFLLSTAAAEVILILATLALDWPLPLIPAQILWLNVATNGIADVALAFEPGEKALFRRRPRRSDEGILDRRLIERLVIVGVWLAIGTLAVYYWQRSIADEPLAMARTTTLTTLVLFQIVHVFNCRSEDVSVFRQVADRPSFQYPRAVTVERDRPRSSKRWVRARWTAAASPATHTASGSGSTAPQRRRPSPRRGFTVDGIVPGDRGAGMRRQVEPGRGIADLDVDLDRPIAGDRLEQLSDRRDRRLVADEQVRPAAGSSSSERPGPEIATSSPGTASGPTRSLRPGRAGRRRGSAPAARRRSTWV